MANQAIIYVHTPAGLAAAVEDLQKAPRLSLDLEFDRNRFHYGITLCLVQVATENTCYIIDPLALKQQLQRLFVLFEDSKIQKIIHSSDEDVRILKYYGCNLTNLYDTSLAVRLLNYEQFSLGYLLQDKLGLEVDKKLQKSNWHARPLTEAHLRYAASDVIYLQTIKGLIDEELQAKDLVQWHEEECRFLLSKAQPLTPDEEGEDGLSLDGFFGRLSPARQYLYQKLWSFRDQYAKNLDSPPGMLVSAKSLKLIVQQSEEEFEQWYALRLQERGQRSVEFTKTLGRLWPAYWKEADEQGLSDKVSYSRVSAEEIQRRNRIKMEVFKPIQDRLAAKYGVFAVRYFFSMRLIEDLVAGHLHLSDWKICSKRLEAIETAAAELKIDLTPYR